MARSQNGWAASPSLRTRTIEPVKGVKLKVVDNEDVVTVFTYLVKNFNFRVDKITGGAQDDWGYSYRANVNSPNELSNHASGTAIDLDATEHPNGVPTNRTFSNKQISEIHKILRELDGVIRWGGDYHHTIDAMHFEINVPQAVLATTAKRIRGLLADPQRKSLSALAQEVIAGKWGDGDTRIKKLIAAGYDPKAVQAEVNKRLA